jgi:glutathione S-transferase
MRPILYSFRRCPYAMRARIALRNAGLRVELREVVLRDKPQAFLDVSPSASVPCLVGETVIDESLDIMLWALRQNDPDRWLDMPAEWHGWVEHNDGPFKQALDRTKYETRYPGTDPHEQRKLASAFLADLNAQLNDDWLFGKPTLADYAILPFVRQFAFIDKDWFDAQPWPDLQSWLKTFLASDHFTGMMDKYPQWHEGDPPTYFPA